MRSRPFSFVLAVLLGAAVWIASPGCAKSPSEEGASDAAATEAAPAEAASEGDPADDVPELEWDPERMTKLTSDLARSIRAVRDSFRNDPVLRTPDSGMRRSAEQMMETLRQLDRNASSLATQVERGGDADSTRGTARRIGSLLRDANMIGRRLTTNAWTDERIRPAMKLINEIAPYYGRAPLYDVERMKMLDTGPNPNRRQPGE